MSGAVYRIPCAAQPAEQALCAAPKAALRHWYAAAGTEDYRPATYGQLLRVPWGLCVRMVCEERAPRAVQRMPNSPVCTDSCMEFFLAPQPGEERFLNFEMNARGVLLMGLGEHGAFRCLDPALQAACAPWAEETADGWEIRLCVPDALVRRFFPNWQPKEARRMRGNFYKCGDETQRPHYGSWSPVTRRPVDFHCPECFGALLLQAEPKAR